MAISSRTMELKKVQNVTPSKDETSLKKFRIRDFIEEVKAEFRQITWTSKEELIAYTKIVVGSTFVLGLGVYLVDLSIQSVMNILTWTTRLISG